MEAEIQTLKVKLEALETQHNKLIEKHEESREMNILYGTTIHVMLQALRIYANEEMWAEDENGKRTFFGDGEQHGFELALHSLIEIGAIKQEDEDE